jgi:hypothetical protein
VKTHSLTTISQSEIEQIRGGVNFINNHYHNNRSDANMARFIIATLVLCGSILTSVGIALVVTLTRTYPPSPQLPAQDPLCKAMQDAYNANCNATK